MTTDQPLTVAELPAALRAAVAAVLARLPHGGYGPVALDGEIRGQILHAGHPETATGFGCPLGAGVPPGWGGGR